MSENPYINAQGTDGRSLIYDPYNTFKIWNYPEIYFGAGSPETAIYIPKVDDLILNLEEGKFYRVLQIDPVTFIPKVAVFYMAIPSEQDDVAKLLGVGVGTQSDIFRVSIDKTVMPYSASVDRRCWVGGSDASYAILYRGTPTAGVPMEVISIMYDTNSNQILGNQIPLEAVTAPGFANCWIVKPFYTKVDLQDNELVTIIYYNAENTAIQRGLLLVENTAWIRDQTDPLKYIVDIFAESPFIHDTDPNLVRYPLNLPKNGLNLFGVVLYSNGETKRLPVDGSKFAMLGLDGFVATYPNQTDQWVLRYRVGQNEAINGAVVSDGYFTTKPYDVKVTQVQGMYSVKIFGFPVWRNPIDGYTLQWFMYTLDRDQWIDVTPYVQIGSNSPAFDPTLYGVVQQIQWVIELSNVDPSYGNWVHTQVINFSLLRQGTETNGPRWEIRDQGYAEVYGRETECTMEFVNSNLRILNFGSGLQTKSEWLQKAYYQLNPLIDTFVGTTAPEPNFVKIRTRAGSEIEISVDDWNSDIPVSFQVDANDTIFMHFIRRTVDNDLQLAVGGWSVRQTN